MTNGIHPPGIHPPGVHPPGVHPGAAGTPAELLTWEGDEAAWGGAELAFAESRPIMIFGTQFYQADSGNLFDDIPITVLLERTGLTIIGRDRAGRPRNDPSSLKLMREIWPLFRGDNGTVIDVYAGAQEDPDQGVSWVGPFPFIIGTTRVVEPLVEGVYLAVRFQSAAQPAWSLLSYDLDVEIIGQRP